MHEARCRADWEHTSSLMCLLANVHRDPKRTRPFKPEHFNPYSGVRRGGSGVGREAWWRMVVAEGQRRNGNGKVVR